MDSTSLIMGGVILLIIVIPLVILARLGRSKPEDKKDESLSA